MPEDIDDELWTATVGEELITYTELVKDGSPSFSIENDGSTLTRHILVRWNQLDDAKDAFLGYPEIIGSDGASQYISRHTPDFAGIFLNLEGDPYLFATKLSGQGYGMPADAGDGIHDDNDFPRYRYAKLEVTYETLTYDVLSDQEMRDAGFVDSAHNPDEATLARYVSPEYNPAAEYLTLPTGGFKFVGPQVGGAAAPVPGAPGKITPNYDLSLTWHLVPGEAIGSAIVNPSLANPSIDLCLGNVNSKPFPSLPNATFQTLQYATVANAGTGYQIGDFLAVSSGEYQVAAVLLVTAIGGSGSSGPITAVGIQGRGIYANPPEGPVSVAGGSGSGATFNVSFGAGFPVGSLLMTGATIKRVRSTSGDRLYDLTYRFKFLPQGIQFLYFQGTTDQQFKNAGYFEVTTTGDTNLGTFNNVSGQGPVNIYPWADFNNLFRVPS
jgi:hypothetical protein